MNENHWYPRDPQIFLTDTQWCDPWTERAHNRLTDTYYALGRPIKDDDHRIMNIGKIPLEHYARVRAELFELGWRVDGGEWRHNRIEEVMRDMDEKRQTNVERTKAATASRIAWCKAQKERDDARNVGRDDTRNDDRNVEREDQRNVGTTTTTTTTTTRSTETATESDRIGAPLPSAADPQTSLSEDSKEKTEGGQSVLSVFKQAADGANLPDDLEALCFRVLGKTEMAKCGSRWRKRIAKEPGKLQRVLSELSTMQKEGRAVRNPGACAEDLWKRFE